MLHDPFRREGPIVTSLADDDFYKLSMLSFLLSDRELLAQARTRFSFKNRTAQILLSNFIAKQDLQRELEHVASLRFTETELRYLSGHFVSEETPEGEVSRRMFSARFPDELRALRLSPIYATHEACGAFDIAAIGSWAEATLWEIHVLQIVAQLYFEALIRPLSVFQRQAVWAEGVQRLQEKIAILRKHPDITITDFGTRRRACGAWQRYVNTVLLEELGPGQYRGTSNILLSMENHTVPMGTFAHELVMGMSGIMHATDDGIVASQNMLFDQWYEHFGNPLSIALSDTYGTDFFLRTFGAERAAQWRGTRQDSGDPFLYGERLIAFYRSVGVDPTSKLIIFSDGLDVSTIVQLAERFRGRIRVTFGWGTNLTNDFGEKFHPLSLVMKLAVCNGQRTVKLSDNLAKAMGSPEDVDHFAHIFGHAGTFTQQTRY
ncbi:MAG: nicotinate phosphoribosyltransferase [Candidatus Yanofskybacteria bacterium]|nr:nicotinate phosphoribosyltransferase [Candidatus Yanofskybacteria bacterium]